MTNPALSIETTKDIGRMYGHPGHPYGKKINTKQVKEGMSKQELFPSITNIISVVNPELAGYWQYMGREALRKGMSPQDSLLEADRFRDAAGARGTRVHAFIEEFIDAGYTHEDYLGYRSLPTYKECVTNHSETNDLLYINAFLSFLHDYKPKFLTQETTVYGKTLGGRDYAGTTDFVAEIDGKVIIGDWKCTSKLKDTVALQLSAIHRAHSMATPEGTLEPLTGADACWGIQLKKDASYTIGVVDNVDRAFELFSAAAELWQVKVGIEGLLNLIEDDGF